MKSQKIIAHCLVKNEERFIWYAIKSVLPFVDKIMVWDTGSTDNTVNIIRRIKSDKISFKEVGDVDSKTFTDVRNQMLKATPSEFTWLMILDGDEVWPTRSIKMASAYCRLHPESESLIVRTNNLVGDIYHRLPESAGKYHLKGLTGHLTLRFINLKAIPGLQVIKPHGQQGYFDNREVLVQDRNPNLQKLLNVYYHHATHLHRTRNRVSDTLVPKRIMKLKCEIGDTIPESQIPRVFFAKHPDIVPGVTNSAPLSFWLKAVVLTPLKRIKRRLIKSGIGY